VTPFARFLALALLLSAARLGADPMPVKVAVVVTFEVGADKGDKPGELQFWAERENWKDSITVPGVDHAVLSDGNGTIGVVSGTTVRASNQIMALVLSGQFDFSHTYWLVNGIAGVDPHAASIGSAAWSHYVVDGDIAYEIDARESPASWPYAIIPVGSKLPNQKAVNEGWEPRTMAFELNRGLVDWAFALTKDTQIPDTPAMAAYRATYAGFPNAQKPPFVLCGESFGSCRYWHGASLTHWASDWTRLWTDGKGVFAMSDMEDQGLAEAFTRLSGMGRLDFQRVLFLRTGSNYCMQAPAQDVNKSLHAEYAGYLPSLEAAYRVGSRVTHEIAAHWETYRASVPAPAGPSG
jgi:purine nucleoside permease